MKEIYLFKRFLIIIFFLGALSSAFAQTNTSTGALWNTPGNWSLNHVPLLAEDVVINTNMAMNVPTSSFAVNSITVNNGFTLTIGNSIATVETINVSTFVTTLGTGAIKVGAFAAVHSLTIGGTVTNAGTISMWTAAGQLCNVTMNGNSITGAGAFTFNSLIIGAPVTNSSTSTVNIRGDLTCNDVFNCSAGIISFIGGGAENLNGTTNPTFTNLDLRTAGTAVTVGGTLSNITVNGTLTMNGGGTPSLSLGTTLTTFSVGGAFTMANAGTTFDFGSTVAKTVTITGNLAGPQTITMQGANLAHQLVLGGATNATPGVLNTTAGSGSFIEYNNATTQTVFATTAPTKYLNLKLSGGGTKTFSGATTVNNDLNVTGVGIILAATNTLSVGNNLNITGTGTTVTVPNTVTVTGNLTNSGTGITTWGGTLNTTTVTGNLIVTNNTTFTIGDQAAVKTLSVTGNVQVDAGSTMNVGAFAATHVLTISGNLQVDGAFNMVQAFPANVCNVTFSGAANATIASPGGTGTIAFNQITLTKATQATLVDVQTPITMSSPGAAGTFLTLTTGTFKLSSASTLTPYFGAATICGANGALWLNNVGANVSCVQTNSSSNPGVPTVTGTLHITAGTFAYGSGNDVMLVNAGTSKVWIDGGNFNMYGGVAFSSTSQFTMTSGNLNIYPQGFDNLAAGTRTLDFSSTNGANAVTFTGGTLSIVDPPITGAGGTSLFVIGTGPWAYNFSGGTINFGDGVSNKSGLAGVGFTIEGGSRYSLGNVVLNNGSSSGTNRFVRLLNSDCIIGNSLVIGNNANDNFTINGRLLTLNGTLTVGSGTITGSAASSLAIGGNNTPVLTLPAIAGNLANLTINKTGTNSIVNLGAPTILIGSLVLTAGVLEIGNYNLLLTNTAAGAISGSPFSAANMIATDGIGYLMKSTVSAQAINPIGAGTYYTPLTLTSVAPAAGNYSVRAVPTSLNPAYISVYWDFVTAIAGKTITATFQYDPAQLNGADQVISYTPAPYTTGQNPPVSGTSSFGANSFTITGNTTATTGAYWTMGSNQTYYSYQTGNWNVPTTWTSDPSGTLQVGSSIPGYNDNVVILGGRTVSLTGNVSTVDMNLAINSSGFLDMSTFSFSAGLSSLSGQGTLRLASVNFPTVVANTLINAGGGTVEYYNASSFTLPVAQTTYNNLTINCTSQVATQLMNLTLNGNLLVKSGTFQINDNTSARRQLTINGNVTVFAGASISVGIGVTNTVTDPTTISTSVAGPFIDYYDAQSHRVVILGDFINSGTVNFSNITYPIYNSFPPTVVGATTGFATVYFRGSTNNVLTCNNTTNFYNLVLDKGTDQTYSLTLNASANSNFKLLGANNAAADALVGATATNPNIKKALWIRNGTLVLQGSTVIPSLTEGNITAALPATSDYFIPANAALYINGPDVVLLSTADDYQEVNTSYSVSGGSGLVNGVIKGGFSSLYVYGKFQMSDGFLSTRESGGIITNGGSGQIIINGGNVDVKQFLNAGTSTASFQMTNGSFFIRGRFQRTPTSYASIANLTDVSAATLNTARALNGTTSGVGSFNLNNATNIFNMSGGNIWVYDVTDAAPPATAPNAFDVNSSASNISVTGGTLTIVPTTGTVLADETNYLISSKASLANFTVNRASGASVVQLNAAYPLTVLANMNIQSGAFDANAQNLTIGGNFTISAGTSYVATGASANTTILNGTGGQTITVNTAGALNLNSLTLTKAAGVNVNFAGSQQTINLSGNLNLTLGTLNDNGNSIFVAGNVYNSGLHSGTGKISLNGSASAQTIDGNGTFQNLELNNTNAAAAPVSLLNNITINGALTLSQNKLFNISTYNLKLTAAASIVNAGPLRYMQCAGNAGDGGITKVYSSTATFIFPVGAPSTSHAGVPNYTPASIGFGTAPTVYGSINVVPVGYAHPNETTAGRSLTYFWRVKSTGFTLGAATITHGYTYSVADVVTGAGITENGYVAARFNVSTASWSEGTTSDLDIVAKIIGQPTTGTFLKNVIFIDGDYTAGDNNPTDPFGTPKVFYSFATGAWGTSTNWTADPTRATLVNIGVPGATDVVHIGAGHTISFGTPANYLTNPNTDPHSCATLYIDAASVLDVRYNPSSNLGIVMNSSLGNGKIRITTAQATNSTFANPAGDFTSFNTNLGTTELYSTNPGAGTTYWMANGVSTYGNLLFSPLGGSNIIFPNNDVLIYGDCTETGANADSWLAPAWAGNYPLPPTTTIAKTITINGNLNVQGGAFEWYGYGNVAQNVVVNGNVVICSVCAIEDFGAATNQTLTIGGSLINDGNGLTNGGAGTLARVALAAVPVIFNGNTSASITNTVGTPTTIFGSVTVNKGSSQATTLNCNIAGTLTTPVDNWLTLLNGTLQYQRANPATDLTISTVTNLNIPSTAGLYINYANASNKNVLIANNGADASDLLLSGKLTVVSGNVYVGSVAAGNFNNDIEYSGNTATIQVDGGNLLVNGQIRRSTASTNGALSYIQNGGAVSVNGNSSAAGLPTAATRAKLEVLNSGSQFNMSAGTLTFVKGGGTTFGDMYIRPFSSTVSGGTITFTNIVPNTAQTYSIDANTPLNNLSVVEGGAAATNATVILMTNPLVLKGTLTLANTKSILNANSKNVTIGQDLVNNGVPGSYLFGTNLTTFSGTSQNISGTSVTNFYDLTVAPSLTLTVNNNFTVNRNLTISSGSLLLNTSKVSVLTNGSFINNGAYSDDNTTGGISMAGSSAQQVSGTGSFNRLEISNAAGVTLLNDITLDHDLVMTNGIFNIKSANLILNTTSNISGAGFSATKMIMTDGVATSLGLTKFFPVIASTTTFTYPVGVSSKYTPAVYTINANGSIGFITVAPVNSYQPTVVDPTKVLDYYFSISSSGITGFDGNVVLNYLPGDVNGTESNYVAAWLQLPGTFWSKAAVGPATDNVNETTHQITFVYTAGTNNLDGDYTAGEDAAIPSQVPTYISNANGNWSDNTIWTPVGSSPPCPAGGPNGDNVIIQNVVSTTVNNCFAYTTVIQGTGQLSILAPTFGHNFGTVDGDPTLGTGTVYVQTGNLPAGNFTPFMDCAGNGTVEFGGATNYTIISNGITTIPNLTFSGTGTRVLPNYNLTICNRLKIDGPTLDNSVSNIKLTIDGSMERYNTGVFTSGSGAGATVTFAGSAAQTVGGATGDFNGINGFNNLEVNNSSGLSIGTGGTIEVNGNLLLTSGIITTSLSNSLSLLNTSSSAVVPTGGSTTSYISGPLKKQIVDGGIFVYPLGKGAVKGHTFTFTSTTAGTSLFTAEFFTPNPASSVTPPLVNINQVEYWATTATAPTTAKVDIAWDAQSDIDGTMTQNGITDIEVAEYNTGTSSWVGLPSTQSGTNTVGDAQTTSSVSLSTTPKNYTLGSLTNTKPTATFSPAGAVCGTSGIPVTFTTHTIISLTYTISYNFNGAAQTPIVVTTLPFTLPTPSPGTYQLTGFTYNSSTLVGVVDPTIVTAFAAPTTSMAGSNQSLCNATSLNLSGNNPTVGTGLWTITSGTGGWFNVPDATHFNALFGGPPGHSYTLKWTITNGACKSSSTVNISFPFAPSQPSPFTVAPTSVCQGSNGNVYSVPPVGGALTYVWSYSGTGATIVGSSNSVSVNFSLSATNGTMSVSAVNGCGVGTARTVGVTTVATPVATFSYTATPYCQLSANPSPTLSGSAGTFSSTAGLVFISPVTGQVNLLASTPGTYTVTNTIAAGPCGIITATSPITVGAIGSWWGGVSNDWFNANNWICLSVPISTTDVLITPGSPIMPVINAAGAVCKSITINAATTLTINGANNLDVYGNWTNNGTFTRNNSTVTFNGTGSVSGTAVTTFNNVTIAATGNLTFPATNENVAGNWTNNGTFSPSTGTVTFNGALASTINSSSTETFYNLAISDVNGVTLSSGTQQVSNQMTFVSGIVTPTSTLNILNGANVSGASNASYVNGFVTKTGNSAFTFPVGNGGFYQPIGISAPLVNTDAFTAEYFYTSANGLYPLNQYAATLDHVGAAEYWYLNRTAGGSSVNVTLNWNTNSGGVGNLATLRVAGWDVPTSKWLDLGNSALTGTTTAGSVTTSSPVASFGIPNSPFTLASTNTQNPLPIQLTTFACALMPNGVVKLNWTTESELNNDHFDVERSSDGTTFSDLTSVQGAGTTSAEHQYSYVDKDPVLGRSYYRLKQNDFDGYKAYSELCVINDDLSLPQVLMYPNPAANSVSIEYRNLGTVSGVKITNSIGTVVSIPVEISGSLIKLNTTSLPSGLYIVELVSDMEKIDYKLIIAR